ncbi:MAG TPA: DUF302 domain-containing protein [Flavobacteriales bacterium]|nr:DUF302 domain-containing protein [Flavobacteriales bacterium]HQW42323.1 DUF302 domain-containing protein [Flavobacteriales bacterium]
MKTFDAAARTLPGSALDMDYCITRTIDSTNLMDLKQRTVDALKSEGFGVLTEIDLQATLKAKLNKDIGAHLILGACNPGYAHQVVSMEPHISTMLPCNVTIRQLPSGQHEVTAIDPASAMGAVDNEAVQPLAIEVRDALQRVVDKI